VCRQGGGAGRDKFAGHLEADADALGGDPQLFLVFQECLVRGGGSRLGDHHLVRERSRRVQTLDFPPREDAPVSVRLDEERDAMLSEETALEVADFALVGFFLR
jgi:hypothetical protein